MKGKINGAFLESGSAALIDYYKLQVLHYYIFGKTC